MQQEAAHRTGGPGARRIALAVLIKIRICRNVTATPGGRRLTRSPQTGAFQRRLPSSCCEVRRCGEKPKTRQRWWTGASHDSSDLWIRSPGWAFLKARLRRLRQPGSSIGGPREAADGGDGGNDPARHAAPDLRRTSKSRRSGLPRCGLSDSDAVPSHCSSRPPADRRPAAAGCWRPRPGMRSTCAGCAGLRQNRGVDYKVTSTGHHPLSSWSFARHPAPTRCAAPGRTFDAVILLVRSAVPRLR